MTISRLPRVGLLASLVIALSCQRAPSELRRPWPEAELEAVTFDGMTLRARRLGSGGREQSVPLGPVRAGEVWFHAAVEGASGTRAFIDLDPPTDAPCVIEGSPTHWKSCRLGVTRAASELSLRVRLEGTADARVAVSAPLLHSGSPSPALVIIILTDTLRSDCLVTYRPAMSLGVALDRLAHDGVVFDHALSSSSWTRTAVATLFTGLDASTHTVLERDDLLPRGLDGLPQAMQRAGYQTLAWSANPNILPLWGFDAGFDVFFDVGASAWPKEKAHAAIVLTAVRAALAERAPMPRFLYVHLMDPHAPYRPNAADVEAITRDAALMATFPGETPTDVTQAEYVAYLAEIRGMDRELGTFFDELRAQALYDDATILLLADHGEEFLDHGGLRHGKTLYQEMLHVPVVLKLPHNALAGTHIAGDVGLADLGPTLLGALGIGELRGADGRNLWNPSTHGLRDESAVQSALLKIDTYHKAALLAGPRKLILDYRATDQLFDLHSDPKERHDLLPAAAHEAAQMRSTLDARIARHESGWHVRVCGADQSERRRVHLEVRGDAHGAFFEEGDAIRLLERRGDTSEYEANLTLAPRPSERVVDGRLWKGMRADEDELVASSADADTLTITSASGEALRYAAGMAAPGSPTTTFTAHIAEPATRVRPSDPLECRPQLTSAGTTAAADAALYVRVWYVAQSEHVDDARVDPALRERLRALGYQQ